MGRKLSRPKKESQSTGNGNWLEMFKQFIHSIWFSMLILIILLLLLICWGCQYQKELAGNVIIDVNGVQVIKIPAGTKVGNITIKKKGTFFADEAAVELLRQTYEKGLMHGFMYKTEKENKTNKI